jgi:hypothetical protein
LRCEYPEGACLEIEPKVFLTNLVIDGTNAWSGGKQGLYWYGTSSAASQNIRVTNVRRERPEGDNGYGIYLYNKKPALNVILENVMVSPKGKVESPVSGDVPISNGFYLDGVQSTASMRDCVYVCVKDDRVPLFADRITSLLLENVYFVTPAKTDIRNMVVVDPEHESYNSGSIASPTIIAYKRTKNTVSSGSSNNLASYRDLYGYTLPQGKVSGDIVGVGIAGSNDHCYYWFRDGTVCSGTSDNADKYQILYAYTLPNDKTPNDIVGIAIAGSNDHCYVWFKDGTVCSGTSDNLFKYRTPYPYSLPSGKTPDDILGVGIAKNDHCYYWFRDGKVCSGTSDNADKHRTLYAYEFPSGKAIVGIGIAGSNDHCYAWYFN